MKKKFLLSVLLLSLMSPHCLIAQTFSIAKFSIGESRINLDLADFLVELEKKNVQAGLIKNSVQWIRDENNLLTPRVLIGIIIKKNNPQIHVTYFDKKIIPNKKNNFYYTQFFVDLFHPGEIIIHEGETILDKITIRSKGVTDARSKQLIDYSCSPFDLKILGIDSEYLSIGCKLHRLGKIGKELSRLEITMNSTNLRTINGDKPPFTIYLDDNSPVELQVIGQDEKIQTLKISAQFPKRQHRLKSAVGFGPYIHDSFKAEQSSKNNLGPSVMLYGKFDLTETSSFKFFDALIYSKTIFNNSGLYFSYDLAEVFDGRLLFNALLGMQGLHYKFDKNSETIANTIYPQGFEVVYRHFYGMENKHLTYGMFIGTGEHKYINSWLRFGGAQFLELNYIKWAHRKDEIRTWGVSIGLPLFSAL